MLSQDELVAAARRWRDEDPDPVTRAEVDQLLATPDLAALQDRFGGRLQFGTAGLRGELGAGPNRMNRAVVIRATAGLAAYLADQGQQGRPVLVGYDARHRSDDFAADAAAVMAAAGHPVHLADRPVPTPVAAFGVLHLGCCAGIQVTASHNPPRDNGYKVYLGDGAQIVSPADTEISAHIDAVGELASVARSALDDTRIRRIGADLVAAYVAGVAGPRPAAPADGDVRVVYTPLHGVGRDVVLAVFDRVGRSQPVVVAEQADPDPDFPTVAFPNPEEPGALDLALGLARREQAHVLLANDPDADRLAVAVPSPSSDGGWRALTGDEVGILLADWLVEQDERDHDPGDRLVVTTIVSSSMLSRLAAARGVTYAETLTGFKWIARAAFDRPGLRFVYGYEEALGSCVGELVRDKDGISAALAFTELVAAEQARGRTVLDRLDDLSRELGVHVTRQRSVPVEGDIVARLVGTPPVRLAGRPVTSAEDLRRGERLPPTEGIVLRGDGVRVIVRPSGTEPKVKCYAEAVLPADGTTDLADTRRQGAALVRQLLDDLPLD